MKTEGDNKVKKRLNVYIILQILCVLIGGISVFSIYLIDDFDESLYGLYSIIIGLLFWISVLFEIVFSLLAFNCSKKMDKKYSIGEKTVGVISFFKTKSGTVSDILLILSLVMLMLLFVFGITKISLVISVLTVLYISFNLHCIFNGINYRVLLKMEEKNREKNSKKRN